MFRRKRSVEEEPRSSGGVNYNDIMAIHREGARIFSIPGVIRGTESVVVSREQLQQVFGLSDREASCYGHCVSLGWGKYDPEPQVRIGRGRTMRVTELRERLKKINGTAD